MPIMLGSSESFVFMTQGSRVGCIRPAKREQSLGLGHRTVPVKMKILAYISRHCSTNTAKTRLYRYKFILYCFRLLKGHDRQDFNGKLRRHLLRRALGKSADASVSDVEDTWIEIKDDCIFEHTELHLNYTTYDLQDKTHIIRTTQPDRANIMVLAADDETNSGPEDAPRSHFLYARVVKAYHAQVYYSGPGSLSTSPSRFDFLWVRYYNLGEERPYSLRALHFSPVSGSSTLEFLDPADILRSVHIIPAFAHRQRGGDPNAVYSPLAGDRDDWLKYYVGRYVDMLVIHVQT